MQKGYESECEEGLNSACGSVDRNMTPLERVLDIKADLNKRLHEAVDSLESKLESVLMPEPKSETTCSMESIDAGSSAVLSIQRQNAITQNAIDKIYSLNRRLEV